MTRSSDYGRDPLLILIEREAVTCKGCVYIKVAWDHSYCSKGKQYGKRCKNYVEKEGQMNLVRKIEVVNRVRDPLTEILDIYVQWTRRDDVGNQHRDREQDDEYSNASYLQADINTAEAVETMIWELKEIHRWAINKRCGISDVWRYPNAVFADVLVDAEVAITIKMKSNFATRDYFK